MKKADQWSALVLLFISGLICWGAILLPYGEIHNPGPGFFPLWLGIILAAMAVGLMLKTSRAKEGARALRDVIAEDVRWDKVLWVVASLIIYGYLLEPVGFLTSTLLLMVFLLRFIDPQPWRSVVLWTLLGSIGSYMIFEVWMKLRLPKGFFGV